MTIRQIVERWVNHIPRNRIFNSEKETLISSLEEFVKKEIDDFEYASCEPTGLKKRLIGTGAEQAEGVSKANSTENCGVVLSTSPPSETPEPKEKTGQVK